MTFCHDSFTLTSQTKQEGTLKGFKASFKEGSQNITCGFLDRI